IALLVLDRVISPYASAVRARWKWATYVVAALSVFAFTNFGQLHGVNGIVHPWEQYHFFVGSKYLGEVGYFDIYKATILADREGTHELDDIRSTRDLHDFNLLGLEKAMADKDRVRARFSDDTWADFKADWANLSRWPAPWEDVVSDHGNSGSPAWALVALPFVEMFGSSHTGQWLLASIDMLLMAAMFAFLFRTFGSSTGAFGLVIWCLAPFCYDYLGGSILRWDWLFALGMAIGFYKRERPIIAGAFLGYAILSKIFPIFFAFALGFRLIVESVRERRLHPHLWRLAAGAAGCAAVFVIASSIVFGGPSIWKQYADRIDVAQHEKYYPNQYSLKTVYLQFVESTPHNLAHNLVKPAEIKQARADVDIADHELGFLIVRVVFTLIALLVIARLDPIDAFAAGPFLVFVWLTVNAYYWNMLGLSALVLAARQSRTERLSYALIALNVTWGCYYLYQHLAWQFAEGYFVALMLIVSFVVWCTQALSKLRG
ncbi:MAG TPA: glycosyltransferase 87 family protein, partial [Kofleriaceae bacterium]|nr:glycosyltransferase 87 family protein [Kofleriaceae bacterium]